MARKNPSDIVKGMDSVPPTDASATGTTSISPEVEADTTSDGGSTPTTPSAPSTNEEQAKYGQQAENAPSSGDVASRADNGDRTPVYAGTVNPVRTPQAGGSMIPRKQPARTATIGLRVTPDHQNAYEQWCRDVASNAGVPQKVVTAHVADFLMSNLDMIERNILDWAQE